jgi:lysozyme
MRVNQEAIDLIKEFEGLKLTAYQDSVGVWTIGYGTTAAAGVGITPRQGMTITQSEAEWYLQKAIQKFADAIKPSITAPVNENQFGAMVSLAYNVGPNAFKRSSVLKRFNSGDIAGAADAFRLWNKARNAKTGKMEVLRGLVRRREAERALFLKPVAVKAVAPNPAPIGGFWQGLVAVLSGLFRSK